MNTPVSHHPKEEMLLEFSAGTLESVPSMCVSVHLHFCERCRAKVSQLNELGAEIFAEQNSISVNDDALDKLFARIDGELSTIDSSQVKYIDIGYFGHGQNC